MANAKATIDLVLNSAKFKKAAGAVVRVMAAMKAKMGAVASAAKSMLLIGGGAITGFLKIAADQQASEAALDIALKATGQSVDRWSQKMRDAASAIQDVTIHGDEVNLMLMVQLTNLGVTADKLDGATRGAIGLATALGQDIKSGARNFALALAGNTMMLGRYIPALRSASSEAEKLALVIEFARRGFLQAENVTKTFTGRVRQLWNSFGDMNEVLGDVFIPDMERLVEKIKDIIPVLSDWIKHNKSLILSTVKWTGAVLLTLVLLPKIVAAVGAVIKILSALKIAYVALQVVIGTSAIAMAAWTGGIMIAVAAIAIVFAKISQLNSALEKSARSSEDFARIWKEFSATQNTIDRTTATEDEQIEGLQKAISARKKLIGQFQKEMESFGKEPGFFDVLLGTAPNEDQMQVLFAHSQRNRDNQSKILEEEEQLLQSMQRAREAWLDSFKLTPEQSDAQERIDKLREKLALLSATYGMTATEVEVYRLSLKKLIPEQHEELKELLALADAEDKRQEGLKRSASATKTAKDRIKALTHEIQILTGATEDQLELIDLKNLGAAGKEMKALKKLMSERLTLQSAQALREEADNLKELSKSSGERLADELKRLDVLKQAGELDEAWFKRLKTAAEGRVSEGGQSSIVGRFEGLQAAFRRIQTAAASSINPELHAAEMTAKSTTSSAKSAQLSDKKLGGILDVIKPVVELIREFTSRQSAGIFGP